MNKSIVWFLSVNPTKESGYYIPLKNMFYLIFGLGNSATGFLAALKTRSSQTLGWTYPYQFAPSGCETLACTAADDYGLP
jgi:hypothetical protein